jgi:hypothetical protein
MRTPKEVADEIKALENVKQRVRPRTYFGDDNLSAIEAQIDVLSEGMDNDEIFDKEDDGEWSCYQRESAEQALEWLEGADLEDGSTPSKQWESIAAPEEGGKK